MRKSYSSFMVTIYICNRLSMRSVLSDISNGKQCTMIFAGVIVIRDDNGHLHLNIYNRFPPYINRNYTDNVLTALRYMPIDNIKSECTRMSLYRPRSYIRGSRGGPMFLYCVSYVPRCSIEVNPGDMSHLDDISLGRLGSHGESGSSTCY